MARSAWTEVAPLHLAGDEAEIDADSKQHRADRTRMVDERRRRIRIGADGHAAGAENARLLAADILARAPQVVGVVDRNRRDDRHVGIDDIDRVQTSAEADFEHKRIGLHAREQPQRRERSEFEIRERYILPHRFDSRERCRELGVRRLRAGNAHTLVIAQQMR